jgi:hypothetical protein
MTQMLTTRRAIVVRQPGILPFPPRTRLYCLAPQASESIWRESMTSYINRLGWTHHVSPRSLVAEVINPQLPERTPFVAVFCMQPAMMLNENDEQARRWGEIVGQLTGQSNLHRLTLFSLLGDFPPHGILRRTPAWCPVCLAEWQKANQILYQPLLWMMRLVTICPSHHIPLVDRCPACYKLQKVLTTNKTNPFECTSCATWLGGASSPDWGMQQQMAQLLSWQAWVISALEELHTASTKADGCSWKSFFSHLSSYLKEHRAYSRLAQAIGTSRANFHKWVTNRNDVGLETLFKFCYHCEVTPWQVMNGQLESLERVLQKGVSHRSPLPPRLTSRLDRERALYHLQAALNEQSTPPSLRQVEREFGGKGLLARYFPDECAQIIQRYAEYRSWRKEQRLRNLRESVRQAVFSLHESGEYPLRYKLTAFFPNGAMRLPEAIEAWREAMGELGLDPDNQRTT